MKFFLGPKVNTPTQKRPWLLQVNQLHDSFPLITLYVLPLVLSHKDVKMLVHYWCPTWPCLIQETFLKSLISYKLLFQSQVALFALCQLKEWYSHDYYSYSHSGFSVDSMYQTVFAILPPLIHVTSCCSKPHSGNFIGCENSAHCDMTWIRRNLVWIVRRRSVDKGSDFSPFVISTLQWSLASPSKSSNP